MSRRRRLFFALEPDRRVRNQLEEVQNELAAEGKRVIAAQFHVTLAFLGMQSGEVIPRLQSLAAKLSFPTCTVKLDRVGQFPRAGVLWLGASQLPEKLDAFRMDLVEALEDAGIDRDRKAWELHVTLYRRLRKPPPIMEITPVTWALDGFSLIESVGVKNGVEYRSQGRWSCISSDKRRG